LGAILGDLTPENPKTGGDRKEGPQGAEITAPEPLSNHSEGKNEDEEKKDKKIDFEDR
jgi:hypothetical protein